MHPHFPPTPPGHPAAPDIAHETVQLQRIDRFREATQRAQRAFILVNAIPFVAGVLLSSFTDVPAVHVYGQLNLGLVWGILQCGLFLVTAWLYENRSARTCDPLEQSLVSGEFPAEGPRPGPVDAPGSMAVKP
ncbi:DUF485 domain-containing protein [Streptomyces blattellae]|uniref:DUF485 domain-containing protein n=1 Tax=Streptomyces blattellae TaxID=2569855 RepID=UPI0018ACBA05|nr:DUF485 domain-containing protein [Streptomyces blattellae]